jgi:hypothetical protein
MRNTQITLLHKQVAKSMDTKVFCLGDLEKLYGELCAMEPTISKVPRLATSASEALVRCDRYYKYATIRHTLACPTSFLTP